MSQNTVRIAVAGAKGRMGREAVRAITATPDLTLAGVLVRHVDDEVLHDFDTSAYDDAARLLETEQPDVWLDLTTPATVVNHVNLALDHGVRPVVGATGYGEEDLSRWDELARTRGIGGIACPNFAVGALLMMRFAKEAAKWMEKAEIIELHHDQKKDKPSGTALRTALAMETEYEVPIHSVRLPGLVAHQEVIFGGTGEILTIRHDSLNRESFMPGLILACRRVMQLRQMVYGLENLLW
ncbi:4-hydroxy-tetrahydrodipicolinate reductase [Alicyclobacillus acidoterrestris]|uniref:4-hydroxy-tetrahydrodipicolinate reductase n=1 Tax=Alicyclobacillus acidoterrestris (strain ATCC 49025 / DSM 3922 / CIP 106132 / NCIMB 13137 / GD3B) TaxID=1356854 RepID=A0A9E7CUS8_ALIAG|nr:4-hydroxy-tetrahydrodipicolinate reductase [Alicyclobacillus acidoterrestris]UNO47348.1 4-hydroxy-tetrahydrodipicolinate reductase [Alicyclobacillus acidoterrestris]